MKVMNFGSLNIDHVYNVKHFVRPGETLAAEEYHKFAGGKGLNQSIALVRSGMTVLHAGRIGTDGQFLKEMLESERVDCRFLVVSKNEPTGHAVIQVSESGENCIVLFGGANRKIRPEQIEEAFSAMEKGDFLLLQNEISMMDEIIRKAAEKGLRIFFNPAPMTTDVKKLPLELLDTLIVNETEGSALADAPVEHALEKLRNNYPGLNILMTLGSRGALYAPSGKGNIVSVPAEHVDKVVDTTAAGDTFIGYFLAETAKGKMPPEAMKKAARASAVCVGIRGAANSIPRL